MGGGGGLNLQLILDFSQSIFLVPQLSHRTSSPANCHLNLTKPVLIPGNVSNAFLTHLFISLSFLIVSRACTFDINFS